MPARPRLLPIQEAVSYGNWGVGAARRQRNAPGRWILTRDVHIDERFQAAMDAFARAFHDAPPGGPAGARDLESTYRHLLAPRGR